MAPKECGCCEIVNSQNVAVALEDIHFTHCTMLHEAYEAYGSLPELAGFFVYFQRGKKISTFVFSTRILIKMNIVIILSTLLSVY